MSCINHVAGPFCAFRADGTVDWAWRTECVRSERFRVPECTLKRLIPNVSASAQNAKKIYALSSGFLQAGAFVQSFVSRKKVNFKVLRDSTAHRIRADKCFGVKMNLYINQISSAWTHQNLVSSYLMRKKIFSNAPTHQKQ